MSQAMRSEMIVPPGTELMNDGDGMAPVRVRGSQLVVSGIVADRLWTTSSIIETTLTAVIDV